MQQEASFQRDANLSRLSAEPFDVLVIGGGVTGAGVAVDAAIRGYRVALVEKSDFASGTSSKSTKLAHGGIRYLPNFDFALVHEALVERGLLLRNAPFLVHPLAFVLPLYQGERHPVGLPITLPGGFGVGMMLGSGLWLYDLMAGRNKVHQHRHLKREEVLRLAPSLRADGLKEGFLYYDAQTNDARLTLTLLRTAADYGTLITNYTGVTSFLFDENGKISGARVYDSLGQRELDVRARHVVNASGIFAEQVEALAGGESQLQISPSKGVHLVFSRRDLPIGEDAIVLPETDDKRILFIVPWQSRVLLGTTDTGSGDLDRPAANTDDIEYLLHHLNRYLKLHLTTEHIVSTYAGYRPLLQARSSHVSNAQLSRTHTVLEHATGLVSIVGGKLTTYRRMAQDTVDILNRRDGRKPIHPTRALPLHGSRDWSAQKEALEREALSLGLDQESATSLGRSYGTEMSAILDLVKQEKKLAERLVKDLPYLKAEVVHASRSEMAQTPEDVLARRMAIILEDRARGVEAVEAVVELMGRELGWSLEEQKTLAEKYRTKVQASLVMETTAP
jgi:glycerol-3-phosphate dehydrogenase